MSECFVLSREELVQSGFIIEQSGGKAFYRKIKSFSELKKILRVARDKGEYREREGKKGVEKDPTFQQLIMYGYVVRSDGKFLVYERGGVERYDEERLAGKVAVGIGGHMEPTDLSIPKSLYRELTEEAEIVADGEVMNFSRGDGTLDIRKIKRYVTVSPRGLIKDERDEVGKVHFGIVCQILPKSNIVEVRVKTGGENERYRYVSPAEYKSMVESRSINPEGWTELVVQHELTHL